MRCVGGTAGCHAFQPRVVQCVNRGFDGYDVQVCVCGHVHACVCLCMHACVCVRDLYFSVQSMYWVIGFSYHGYCRFFPVQWECKTDMDSAYRFGRIQVSCEGYEYPDDPYILRGSCGVSLILSIHSSTHLPCVYLPSNLHFSFPLSSLPSSLLLPPFLSLPLFFPIVGVWIRHDGGGLPATTGRRKTIPWPLLPPQPSTLLWSAAIRRLGEIDHTGGGGDSCLLVGEMLLFWDKKEDHLSSIQLFLLW